MFCTNCGNKIEFENSKFCSKCGASLTGGPAPQPQNTVNGQAAQNAQNVQPAISKLYTTEPPAFAIAPDTNMIVRKAFANAQTLHIPQPTSVNDPQFKAKCEYCRTVFTYHYSNLGYRKWYQHGFVYCPSCRKPLRHSLDLLVSEFVHEIDGAGQIHSHPVQ